LPHLSKVLEKIVLQHWFKPAMSNKIKPDQFAFTSNPGLGCSNALTTAYDAMLRFTDTSGDTARVLAIDFVKAFDRAASQHILSALVKLNVPRECFLWICSFLRNRMQRVRVGEEYSQWLIVRSGVPQGSVLGPYLFAILIDSLSPCLSDRTICVKYADDITLVHHIPRGEMDLLNVEWNAVLKWTTDNDLEINVKKTKVMTVLFVKKQIPHLHILYGNDGAAVEEVDSLKLLGLTISKDLKWNCHVDVCVKRAHKNMFLLRQLKFGGLPNDTLWHVYFALIRSLITYAAPATINMAAGLFHKLCKVERRIEKIIGETSTTLLPNFVDNICIRLVTQIKNNERHPLRALFTANHSAHKTRHKSVLLPPFAYTSRWKTSFIKYAAHT
jgi:hypothetical protein